MRLSWEAVLCMNVAGIITWCSLVAQSAYCDTIGVEFTHIASLEQQVSQHVHSCTSIYRIEIFKHTSMLVFF